MVDIYFIRQKQPKGLGHAINCAKTFVGDEPFAVLLGDDIVYNDEYPCLKQLIDCYDEYKTSILGVQAVLQVMLKWMEYILKVLFIRLKD